MPADARTIRSELALRLRPHQVLADFPTLTAYAIDAGIHKVTPMAVVLIESAEDLETTLAFGREHRIPLTARSGGTNLTGNAIGPGIILEFSKLHRILELNTQDRWVRVQPGIPYAELNRALARHGLIFAPDPSSGEMCKIGGMIGTNAAGPHTLKYGAVKDNLLELTLLTASGRRLTAKTCALDEPGLEAIRQHHDWVDPLIRLIRKNTPLLKQKKPRVSKNSSGYNLFALAEGLEHGVLDLPRLFVGSEGTLGLTIEAVLKLLTKPSRTATALIHLERYAEVGRAVNALLPLRPGALELVDHNTLDLIGRDRFGIPKAAQAVLLLELDEEPIEDGMRKAAEICRGFRLAKPIEAAYDSDHQKALWRVRQAIYPTLYQYDSVGGGKKRPVNFADDVVVRVERLPELIEYLDGLFVRLGVPVAIYGHVGDGNAHINPLLDVNAPEDFERMVRIAREVHETVIERFEGSICGEHGDGRVRGEFVRAMVGDELYRLFREVKRLLDPDGLLNPGVKLTEAPFTQDLDLPRLAKPCATCGKCNTVCPVYDVRRDESNAARGWFHILTDPDYSYDTAGRVVEACLNCKSCREVCPAGLDVSSLVLERRAERPNPLAGWIFRLQAKPALFEPLIRTAGWTQPLWDRPIPRRILALLTRPILKRLAPTARLPADLTLPRLASRTLRQRYRRLTEEAGHTGRIAYFHGCAADYFMDGVGDAVIRLLERHGVRVVLPRQRCSGTPIETYGHRDLARAHARFNLESLGRYDKVVTGCASCTLMLKDYPRLLSERERSDAAALADRVVHITQFLVNDLKLAPPPLRNDKTVTYHSSCHLRAAGVTMEPRRLLRQFSNGRFVEMPEADRCAGGAGTYLVKDWELSREIFERKRHSVLESGAQVVTTSCPACMIQLRNGLKDGVQVKHVAQWLEELYDPTSSRAR
jgi:FAD/FMN-containing dehydrogenase/Fe-S oxidoreductase